MSETEKTQKKSWFKGLQAEFKKVIWPDKKTRCKTDHGSCCCFRNPRSVDRGDRRNPKIRY